MNQLIYVNNLNSCYYDSFKINSDIKNSNAALTAVFKQAPNQKMGVNNNATFI